MKMPILLFMNLFVSLAIAQPKENYEEQERKYLKAQQEEVERQQHEFVLAGISAKGHDIKGMKVIGFEEAYASNEKLSCYYSKFGQGANPALAYVFCYPTYKASGNPKEDYKAAEQVHNRLEFVNYVKAAIIEVGVNPEGMAIPEKPSSNEEKYNTIYVENTLAVCRVDGIPNDDFFMNPFSARCFKK